MSASRVEQSLVTEVWTTGEVDPDEPTVVLPPSARELPPMRTPMASWGEGEGLVLATEEAPQSTPPRLAAPTYGISLATMSVGAAALLSVFAAVMLVISSDDHASGSPRSSAVAAAPQSAVIAPPAALQTTVIARPAAIITPPATAAVMPEVTSIVLDDVPARPARTRRVGPAPRPSKTAPRTPKAAAEASSPAKTLEEILDLLGEEQLRRPTSKTSDARAETRVRR